jgi:AraC-like DNA-binding protein
MPKKPTPRPALVDPLSDVLASTQLESGILANFFFSAPWAVDCQHLPEGAPFHAVVAGICQVRLPKRDPVTLYPGDVILLPRWTRHVLASSANATVISIEDVFKLNGLPTTMPPSPPGGPLNASYGGEGEATHLLSGIFYFRNPTRNPLLQALPDVLHFKASEGHLAPWLDTAIRVLGAEAGAPRPGYAVMARRLADLLLVEMLRSFMLGRPDNTTGWLHAMSDRRIGPAVRCVHTHPGEPWTLERLAKECGMSRSAFAAEFRRLVGETPLNYVTGWRMHLAAERLAKAEQSIAVLAEDLGYTSPISFAKAFRRWFGESPGRFRGRHRNRQA